MKFNTILALSIAIVTFNSCGGDSSKKTIEDKTQAVNSNENIAEPITKPAIMGNGSLTIAYVVSDSISKNYKYVIDMKNELSTKQMDIEAKLKREYNRYEETLKSLQEKSQDPLALRSELEEGQKKLAGMQQSIGLKEQQYQAEYAQFEAGKYEEYHKRVAAFIRDYAKENGIDIVFGYQLGANVIYVNQGFNITNAVVAGLNAEYKK